ncbi:MAG TPA: hypothetical protein VF618_01710 [Thermoanaerobaculia bacterium]
MYVWDIRELKQHLIARPLTEREQLPYLVAFVALTSVAEHLPVELTNVWDYLSAVCAVIVAVGGTIYLYKQNGGRSGQHFLQRFFAVGFVVSVRWFVALIVTVIPLVGALEFAGLLQDTMTWYEFVFLTGAELLLYQRVGHHIRDVALRTSVDGGGSLALNQGLTLGGR